LRDEVGDQVGDDLGIGLGAELGAAPDQVGAQLTVVLDDAVVDNSDVALGVGVGVCVGLRCLAVRRPTCVADGGPAGRQRTVEQLAQAGRRPWRRSGHRLR
jgi:hypothetical protein